MITKRFILKNSLIGIIIVSVIITVYVVLPSVMDLTAEKITYTGFPTYSCTKPFEASSCSNKTALDGGTIFTNNGLQLINIDYEP